MLKNTKLKLPFKTLWLADIRRNVTFFLFYYSKLIFPIEGDVYFFSVLLTLRKIMRFHREEISLRELKRKEVEQAD